MRILARLNIALLSFGKGEDLEHLRWLVPTILVVAGASYAFDRFTEGIGH